MMADGGPRAKKIRLSTEETSSSTDSLSDEREPYYYENFKMILDKVVSGCDKALLTQQEVDFADRFLSQTGWYVRLTLTHLIKYSYAFSIFAGYKLASTPLIMQMSMLARDKVYMAYILSFTPVRLNYWITHTVIDLVCHCYLFACQVW